MKNLNKIKSLCLLFSTLLSCQKKEEKRVFNHNIQKEINYNQYYGKWLPIDKKNNKYYYCIDADNFFEINKNKIYNHTPMEDSDLIINHVENKGSQTYLYLDEQQSKFYTLNWIDKEKGIISCKLSNYETNLFIAEEKIKTIENKRCKSDNKSCTFYDGTSKNKFIMEAGEYTNDREQKYPISAWIIITNKLNNKPQEIYFEPNSWTEYSDLPCNHFIINDFNFDGLEDFAIVWDNGGNGGELYEYYFQDNKGIFYPTKSFPLQHGALAENISPANKTITTQSIVGCCHYNLNTYKLKPNGDWEISSEQKELKRN